MILLDTNAAIWLAQGHRRARPLERVARLHLSPATLLEIQFLAESGRVRLHTGSSIAAVEADTRWRIDEPPSAQWFATACELTWTRDPFDRLIVAHAHLRGWRLATGDELLIERLSASNVLAL